MTNKYSNKCLINGKNFIIRGSLAIKIYPDGFGFIVAECEEFETMAWGQTEEEATKELEISNSLYFEELIEKGELATTLAKMGWEVTQDGNNIVIVQQMLIKVKNLGVDKYIEEKSNLNQIHA
jgi:predicted RNase H-like HicB family nuclease